MYVLTLRNGHSYLRICLSFSDTYIKFINSCENRTVRHTNVEIYSHEFYLESCICAVQYPEKLKMVKVAYSVPNILSQNCGIEFRTDSGSRFSCTKGFSTEPAFNILTISRAQNSADRFAGLLIEFGKLIYYHHKD